MPQAKKPKVSKPTADEFTVATIRKLVEKLVQASQVESPQPIQAEGDTCTCMLCELRRAVEARRPTDTKPSLPKAYEETWGVFQVPGMSIKFFPSQAAALAELGANENGLIAFKVAGVGASAPQGLRDAMAYAGSVGNVTLFNPRATAGSS